MGDPDTRQPIPLSWSAAARLGMERTTLIARMNTLGIDPRHLS